MRAICLVDGCSILSRRLGFCDKHSQRFKKHGDPLAIGSGGRPISDRVCDVDDCTLPHRSLGYCSKHYERFKKYGDPLKRVRSPNGETMAWLQSVVDNPPEGCAAWPFPTKEKVSYGSIRWNNKTYPAHRLALILHGGVDRPELQARHGSCHNPLCCNPLHVSWGTRKENEADKRRDGTRIQGERHYKAALTEADVRAIRHDPRSSNELALLYPVGARQIRAIRAHKSWSHVA